MTCLPEAKIFLKLKNIARCRQKYFQNSGLYKNKCRKWHKEYRLKQVQFEVDPPIFEFGVYVNKAVDTDETIACDVNFLM